jgi:hypothetical protein
MELSDDELTIVATKEMARVKEISFHMELSVADAMGLLGTIQLAMRHPNYGETASDAMREIATQLERQLRLVGPAMRELAARGWDPDHDVGPEE